MADGRWQIQKIKYQKAKGRRQKTEGKKQKAKVNGKPGIKWLL
jgi:hypothetical protein